MASIAELAVRISADLKDFDSKIGGFASKMQDIGEKATATGKALTIGVTTPILGLAAGMSKAAMDLEATEAKYETVFAGMTDQADAFIKKFQSLTPATVAEARSMASGIQDLLVPMGFLRNEATNMTGDTMHLVGALANFNSATHSAEDVANAFQSALTGSTEPLKRLGIQINQSSLEAYALANGLVEANVDMAKLNKTIVDIEVAQKNYNDTVKKYGEGSLEARKSLAALELKEQDRDKLLEGTNVVLDAQTRAQALLAMAYEQSGDALEAYTAENLDNITKMEIAKKEIVDVAAKFGTQLLPLISKGTDLIRRLTTWFDSLSESQQQTALKIMGIAAAIGPLLLIVGKLIAVFGKMASGVKAVASVVAYGARAVRLASAAIKAGVIQQKIAMAVTKAWTAIQAAFNAVMAASPIILIVIGIIALIAVIVAAIKYWDEILEIMKKVWEWIKDIFIKGWEMFKEFWAGLWESIKKALSAAWEWIKGLFLKYHPIGLVISHWETIKDFFSGLWDKVKGIFSNAIDGIKQFFKDLLLFFKGIFTGDMQLILESLWHLIASVLGDKIANSILNFIEKVIGFFRRLKDGILGIWTGIVDGIKGFVNRIIDAINGMIGGLNRIKFDIPDWVPIIGGKTWGFNLQNIPHLARGGEIVRTGLAVVGERGPELLQLPKGAMVKPLDNRGSGPSPGGDIYYINEVHLHPGDLKDVKSIADIFSTARNKIRMAGGEA